LIVGVTGLVGLTLGGWIADWLHERSERGRLAMGAVSLALAAAATWYALVLPPDQATLFVAVFAIGWLLQYSFYVSVLPAIQDVVEPQLRATAMAMYFAVITLLGGAFGPLVVGYLSDRSAAAAMAASGGSAMTEEFKAIGLHDAMLLVPVTLFATAVAVFLATRTFPADARAMLTGMAGKEPQAAAA
jgi:MFS family permease